MNEEEIIAQKLSLTQMQLEATQDIHAIFELLKNTLDTEAILYSVQLQAISKAENALFEKEEKITELESKNTRLSINNAVLAGMAVEEEEVLTPEEIEYNKIMNSEED